MLKKLTIIATLSLFVVAITFDVEARRGGGFRSSSFKSRSYSKPKPVKRSVQTRKAVNKKSPATSRQATGRQTVQKQQNRKPVQKFGANVKTKQKVATSRSSYKKQQAAFKPKPKPYTTKNVNGKKTVVHNRPQYTSNSNPVITNSVSSNRSTYFTRRNSHYNGWNTPSYAYHGYSSYGMWDSLALWYMLSNVNDARYSQMYYHQRYTPGMIAWRTEANKQAATNAELRAQLAQMDSTANNMQRSGVRQDASYVPKGVDADLLLSDEVLQDTKPVLNICTGPTDKNYYSVARIIGNGAEGFRVNPIVTAGSAENLDNMESGKCDVALVQRDAYWNHTVNNPSSKLDFERIMSPYAEVLHMVCNEASGIESLTDLTSNTTLLIGDNGSGSQVTWKNIVAEDNSYAKVQTEAVGGSLAKTRVSTGQADCLLTVSGLNTNFMRDINKQSTDDKVLNLVDWNDSDIMMSKDPAGKPVYSTFTVDEDTYSNLQHDNYIGYFDVSNDAVTVPADIIVNNKWILANKATFQSFVSTAIGKSSVIRNYVGTK